MECFLFKQKTAYEWRISDWSADVCSSARLTRHQCGDGGIARPIGARPFEAQFTLRRQIVNVDGTGFGEEQQLVGTDPAHRPGKARHRQIDRKSTRLNSSH